MSNPNDPKATQPEQPAPTSPPPTPTPILGATVQGSFEFQLPPVKDGVIAPPAAPTSDPSFPELPLYPVKPVPRGPRRAVTFEFELPGADLDEPEPQPQPLGELTPTVPFLELPPVDAGKSEPPVSTATPTSFAPAEVALAKPDISPTTEHAPLDLIEPTPSVPVSPPAAPSSEAVEAFEPVSVDPPASNTHAASFALAEIDLATAFGEFDVQSASIDPDAPDAISTNELPAPTGLSASRHAGGWTVILDESPDGAEWTLQLDSPNLYHVCALRNLQIVADARDYLRAAQHEPRALTLGQIGSAAVSLCWDTEDAQRCFLVIGPVGTCTTRVSLSGKDTAMLTEALTQVLKDLPAEKLRQDHAS